MCRGPTLAPHSRCWRSRHTPTTRRSGRAGSSSVRGVARCCSSPTAPRGTGPRGRTARRERARASRRYGRSKLDARSRSWVSRPIASRASMPWITRRACTSRLRDHRPVSARGGPHARVRGRASRSRCRQFHRARGRRSAGAGAPTCRAGDGRLSSPPRRAAHRALHRPRVTGCRARVLGPGARRQDRDVLLLRVAIRGAGTVRSRPGALPPGTAV
jgi:hypothetical protein